MENRGGEKIALSRKSRVLSIAGQLSGLRGTVAWEGIMRRFYENSKTICKANPKSIPTVSRSLKHFPTGSSYEGSWNLFGMSGRGTYVFPHKGVKYVGDFSDGMFHGEGELQYECGAVIKGKWHKGVLTEKTLVFADGLEYNEQKWPYCNYPDRRYTIEYDNGIEPAGRSYITAEQPTLEIPNGYYDAGDGFYDPITKTVYKYEDLSAIVRSPQKHEIKWIEANCRKSPEQPVGPMPFLYEEFVEPSLEAEDTPPPAARTKQYLEEEERDKEEREVFMATGTNRRPSRRFMSGASRTKSSADCEYFYKPTYLKEAGGSSQMSETGVSFKCFKPSSRSSASKQTSRQQSKISRTFEYFASDRASSGGYIYRPDDTSETRESAPGLVPDVYEESIPNW